MGKIGPGCDFDFISRPSSGKFPRDLFTADGDENTVGSVTVNPEKYAAPQEETVAVTVKRERDGKTWSCSGAEYTPEQDQPAEPTRTTSLSALPTASTVLVNGERVALTAYSIGGNNYFKLRDIGKLFDLGIGWDNNTKAITIDTSSGYTE